MRPELAAAKIHTGKHEHWPSARPRHWSGNSQLVVSHGQFLACSVLDGNLDQRTSLVVSVSDERATTRGMGAWPQMVKIYFPFDNFAILNLPDLRFNGRIGVLFEVTLKRGPPLAT